MDPRYNSVEELQGYPEKSLGYQKYSSLGMGSIFVASYLICANMKLRTNIQLDRF